MKTDTRKNFIEKRTKDTLSMPLHQHFGLSLITQGEGVAEAVFKVCEKSKTAAGSLHGGVLYALMDGTSLLCLISKLDESEHAVSHNVNFSLMNPAFVGDDVVLKAKVLKRGKKVAFLYVEAWISKDGDEKLIACGHVTKSIIPGYD